MRIAFAAGLLLAATALACSGGEPVTEPADGGDAPAPDGGGPTNADEDEDAGTLSPSGCRLVSTGFVSGTAADNVAPSGVPGAVSWTDVGDALAVDGSYATVTLADGEESASLRVSGFGLHVPVDKETWGIEVSLTRRAAEGGIEDSKIEVEIEGKSSRFKYAKNPWPVSAFGTHDYGQEIDTWGVDLFAADVNKPSFAAKVSVKRTAGATGPVIASIDAIRVAVHHCK